MQDASQRPRIKLGLTQTEYEEWVQELQQRLGNELVMLPEVKATLRAVADAGVSVESLLHLNWALDVTRGQK